MLNKRMVAYGWILCGIIIPIGFPCVSQALAQEAESTPILKNDQVVLVVPLQHVSGRYVKSAIKSLKAPVNVAVTRGNTLLISGSQENVDSVIRDVVKKLDVPKTQLGTDIKTRVFFVSNPTALLAMGALSREINLGVGTEMVFPRSTGTMIVQGTAANIEMVAGLLDEVNRTQRPLTVYFYFIRGQAGESNTAKLPEALRPIASTLAANGFGSSDLIAPVIVRADENQKFESSSIHRTTGHNGELRDTIKFEVLGSARLDSTEKPSASYSLRSEHG